MASRQIQGLFFDRVARSFSGTRALRGVFLHVDRGGIVRAIQGAQCSGDVTPPALVTQVGPGKLGDANQFDPDSPRRAACAKVREA